MTKLPRDVSGAKLARKLTALGYHSPRQSGSHLILQPPRAGQQPLCIPAHKELKVGLLHNILAIVCGQLDTSMEQLINDLGL